MTQEEINAKILEAFQRGFDKGFDASSEGFNGEFWSSNYEDEDYEEVKARAVANFQDEMEKG